MSFRLFRAFVLIVLQAFYLSLCRWGPGPGASVRGLRVQYRIYLVEYPPGCHPATSLSLCLV